MRNWRRLIAAATVLSAVSALQAQQKDRAQQVKSDFAKFDQDDYWIYNDLDKGIAKARAMDRPLLIVFR